MYMNYMNDEEMEKETDKMSKEDKKAYKDYGNKERSEHDVKILVEAGEIRKDKDRLKMAVHCAKMQKEYLNEVV